jgi:hypothetical protein
MKPILLALVLWSGWSVVAPAEVLVLSNGGRVAGKLLNPHEVPRKQYVIQTDDGAQITLQSSQVKKVLHPQANELEYQRIAPTYADTVKGQWELAAWCRDRKLTAARTAHLRRVVELDPDHAEARRILGYRRGSDGQWITRADEMKQRGLRLYKGKWLTQQEIDLLENKKQQESARQEWCRKMKMWRAWLGTDRDAQGRENILAVRDPAALKALALGLDDNDTRTRLLFVDALANIDDAEAALALAKAAVFDSAKEMRLNCLDRLQTKRRPEVVSFFIGKLRDKDNQVVNRAGVALGRMQDPSAVKPLIEALVTTHTKKIGGAGGGGGMSIGAGFGSGGGGLSVGGGGPKMIREIVRNGDVLDALTALTGQNFEFDKPAWKRWYAAQRKTPDSIDARRDEGGKGKAKEGK